MPVDSGSVDRRDNRLYYVRFPTLQGQLVFRKRNRTRSSDRWSARHLLFARSLALRALLCGLLWLGADAGAVAIGFLYIEHADVSHQVAQFREAVAAGIEIRNKVGQLPSDDAEAYPAATFVFSL